MIRNRGWLAFLATLIMLVSGLVAGAVASSYMTDAQNGSNVKVSGCVVRLYDDGIEIHANGAHMCAGVERVQIDRNGNIEVIQTVRGASANPILFASCQTDETIGGRHGVMCGATGGTEDTSFALYDTKLNRKLNLNNPSDYARISGPVSNLWVGWFHSSW